MTFGIKAVVVALLLLAPPSSAADWSIDALAAALEEQPKGQVAFTETRHISYLSAPLVSRGTLQFENGILRKVVTAPAPETFEIRDDELLHADADNNVTRIGIDDQPVLQSLAVILRAVLSGRLEPTRTFFNLSLSGERAHWDLRLFPHAEKLRDRLDAIVLSGAGGRLSEIVIAEKNGDKTVITLRDE